MPESKRLGPGLVAVLGPYYPHGPDRPPIAHTGASEEVVAHIIAEDWLGNPLPKHTMLLSQRVVDGLKEFFQEHFPADGN